MRVARSIFSLLMAVGLGIIVAVNIVNAQSAPAAEENIAHLVTFGNKADKSWGDDDFCQVFFFLVPSSQTAPIYIRVFDPDTGGEWDEGKGEFDTHIRYTIFGGKGCWSNPDAQGILPEGEYDSGNVLAIKWFGNEQKYDGKWYTFGPFNPFEGEFVEKFDGRVFKLIAEGVKGDDGNLYKYFLSSSPKENKEIEGGNAFTYEYTFRLSNNQQTVSQIYPYVDDRAISVEISNFDWDDDGYIRVVSVAKNGHLCDLSGDNNMVVSKFPVVKEEQNTSMEIQFIKNRKKIIRNNNVVISVRNQYGEALPFFVVPIGGIPVYTPKIKMKSISEK